MSQYANNIYQEGLFVTGVGLLIVFVVLVLLAVVVSFFRFIPDENIIRSSKAGMPLPNILQSEVKLSPLHQAIIIAAILEDVQVFGAKNFVKINKIKELENRKSEDQVLEE